MLAWSDSPCLPPLCLLAHLSALDYLHKEDMKLVTGLLLVVTAQVALGFTWRTSTKSPTTTAAPSEDDGALWAVLVAGSHTWMNYRHQADVYHAYQILHHNGVPDDHIIVMHYDDIANYEENPMPGKVINRPDGPDVYTGVPKDYVGADVTPENFLKVLTGDAAGLAGVGSGKVLASGPKDRVFINLVDHGAPGIFGFPTTFLYESNFSAAITTMSKNQRYKEMTIYLEACESGSMFENLPNDINVYAVSAANATQSSYACYLDMQLHTFLGDVFSIKWMEDTDREDVKTETLEKQFELVRQETTTSHVLQWGQIGLDSLPVGDFVGDDATAAADTSYGPFATTTDPCLTTSVKAEDVPLAVMQQKANDADHVLGADFWQTQVDQLRQNRSAMEETMRRIVHVLTQDDALTQKLTARSHHPIRHRPCYEASVAAFDTYCYALAQNPYAYRQLYVLVNVCEHGYTADQFSWSARAICDDLDNVTGVY